MNQATADIDQLKASVDNADLTPTTLPPREHKDSVSDVDSMLVLSLKQVG